MLDVSYGEKNLFLMVNQRSMKKIDYFFFRGRDHSASTIQTDKKKKKTRLSAHPDLVLSTRLAALLRVLLEPSCRTPRSALT